MEVSEGALAQIFATLTPHLDERRKRLLAGAQARALGRGGIAAVARASGMSRSTVQSGVRELDEGAEPSGRVRRPGAGRPRLIDKDPDLLLELDDLVSPEARGDPMSPLQWTAKSTYQLAGALAGKGFAVSPNTVGDLLAGMGYSLQGTSKQKEGRQHVDRDAQFGYINSTAGSFLAAGEPVISVDTKKKELVGEYSNAGKEYQPKGEPVRTLVHDFIDPDMGKAIPYGVYDMGANEGWVSVGEDADTAAFAVATIKRWWEQMGRPRYPEATKLLICADSGGSNGYRLRAWKVELAKLAKETGSRDHRLPLPARHLEVEQDRAPDVQLHHHELERKAARLIPHRRPADRRHDDEEGLEDPSRPRRGLLPAWGKDLQQGTCGRATHPPRVPRRVELHGPPIT